MNWIHKNLCTTLALAGFLSWMTSCGNGASYKEKTVDSEQKARAFTISELHYTITNIYPHDPHAFTEGLEFHDGMIIESSGEYGKSDIRISELKTGNILAKSKLPVKYFGEGITVIDDKIYQLTYRERTGFIYNAKTLKQTGTFSFPGKEGWGMTHIDHRIVYDDGAGTLHFLNISNFSEVKTLKIMDDKGIVSDANELEYITGFIYANVWRTETIIKIDTTTGKVVARAEMAHLRADAGITPTSGMYGTPEVMNGIAFNSESNKLYITGKFWPKLFELQLEN
jgi:glutamine cyclotransferase